MRLAHISDIHLGKRFYEYSLINDQKYIINQISNIIKEQKADAVIIAGDIYDKSLPSAETVELCDYFLKTLSMLELPVFIVNGNHDCAQRVTYGRYLFEKSGFYIAPEYDGRIYHYSLKDEYGIVNFYLLPFIKPSMVRPFFPDEEIKNYTDAIKCILNNTDISTAERNVIVAHQFVTGAKRSESEDITVGTLDNVDASVFENFNYTALGHIHCPQNIASGKIRYCGSMLKYSFSEAGRDKSVTIADIDGNGDVKITEIPLKPLHDVRCLKGSYEELTFEKNYIGTDTEDYVSITLTDEQDIPNAAAKLSTIYKNLCRLDYDNKRTRSQGIDLSDVALVEKKPEELTDEFYFCQNNQKMTDEQMQYVNALIKEIWE